MGELSKQDWLIIIQVLANMFRVFGFSLIIPTLVALWYKEYDFALVFFTMGISLAIFFSWLRKVLKVEECGLKHAITALALVWAAIAIISAFPFLYYGMSFVDSFFESFSGWSGTGLTMVKDPSILPFTLNFWRAFIQWVGGFGIVILVLLIYEKPKTATALFMAEGRIEDFYISLRKTARTIFSIYGLYTLLGIFFMWIAGMSLFDSVVHTFTSIATGGFSSNTVGMGSYGFWPMVICMFLMMIGGISFVSHYHLLRGRIREFFKNAEVRILLGVILVCFLFVSLEVFLTKSYHYFDSLFYTISSITGTGAGTTVDLSTFPAVTLLIFIFLMITGACYGSTAGAVKIWRMIVVLKIIRRQILKVFLPEHAVLPLKVGEHQINDEDALRIISYIFLYLAVLFVGSVVFMFYDYSMTESIFVVASAQGNVGLNIIPAASYFAMPAILKIQLILHMLLGRVEIIPFLVLLRSFMFVKRT